MARINTDLKGKGLTLISADETSMMEGANAEGAKVALRTQREF